MTNKKKYYHKAMDLFLHQGFTCKQIAGLWNLKESTVDRWRREGGWDDAKVFIDTSPSMVAKKIKEEIYNLIKQLQLDPAGLQKNADSISKLMAIAEKMEKRADIVGHALIVLRDITEWMNLNHPMEARQLSTVWQPLTEHLYSKYSQ